MKTSFLFTLPNLGVKTNIFQKLAMITSRPINLNNFIIFSLLVAILKVCKTVTWAFRPKMGSAKARQNYRRCEVMSCDFA